MGYTPKFNHCSLDGIKTEGVKTYFSFNNSTVQIEVDQPAEIIISRMEEIVNGKRDKLYLTRGMRDIDVSYVGDNKWQLFDEFDIYEFDFVLGKER